MAETDKSTPAMSVDLDARLCAAVLHAIIAEARARGDVELSASRRASLANQIVREIERRRILSEHEALLKCAEALRDSERAIASLPEEALGMGEREPGGWWPLRDELLTNIREALALLEQAQREPQ
jgi:hypothetical protein